MMVPNEPTTAAWALQSSDDFNTGLPEILPTDASSQLFDSPTVEHFKLHQQLIGCWGRGADDELRLHEKEGHPKGEGKHGHGRAHKSSDQVKHEGV